MLCSGYLHWGERLLWQARWNTFFCDTSRKHKICSVQGLWFLYFLTNSNMTWPDNASCYPEHCDSIWDCVIKHSSVYFFYIYKMNEKSSVSSEFVCLALYSAQKDPSYKIWPPSLKSYVISLWIASSICLCVQGETVFPFIPSHLLKEMTLQSFIAI